MSQIVQIEIHKDLPGHPSGSVVRVPCDVNKTPLDSWWRRRLKDAELDGCCSVKKESKPKKSPSNKKPAKDKKA